jgi:hypothetical protein
MACSGSERGSAGAGVAAGTGATDSGVAAGAAAEGEGGDAAVLSCVVAGLAGAGDVRLTGCTGRVGRNDSGSR